MAPGWPNDISWYQGIYDFIRYILTPIVLYLFGSRAVRNYTKQKDIANVRKQILSTFGKFYLNITDAAVISSELLQANHLQRTQKILAIRTIIQVHLKSKDLRDEVLDQIDDLIKTGGEVVEIGRGLNFHEKLPEDKKLLGIFKEFSELVASVEKKLYTAELTP